MKRISVIILIFSLFILNSYGKSDAFSVYKNLKIEKDSSENFVFFKNGGQIKFILNTNSIPYSKKYVDSTSNFYLVNSDKPSKKAKLTSGYLVYDKDTTILKCNIDEVIYGTIVNLNKTGFLLYTQAIALKKETVSKHYIHLKDDSIRYFKFGNLKLINYSSSRRAKLKDFAVGFVFFSAITSTLVAPLISNNYKNGGFNENRNYDVAGAGLIGLSVSIPLLILSMPKKYKLTTKNGDKAKNLWYFDSEPKK